MTWFLRDAEKILCAAIFLAMTVVGFANVVVRYLTSWSLASTEELLTNGFLLLTIFGAAIAARNGEHLAVTLVYDYAPRPIRKAILVLSSLLAVLLLALSAWFCLEMVMNQQANGVRSYALQIPAWYYSVGLPVGFALIIVRHVQHAVDAWRGREADVIPHG